MTGGCPNGGTVLENSPDPASDICNASFVSGAGCMLGLSLFCKRSPEAATVPLGERLPRLWVQVQRGFPLPLAGFSVIRKPMAKSLSSVKRKKKGRPATGTAPLVGVRLPQKLIDTIDGWANREGAASRSEAIRRLLEQALASGKFPRRRTKKSASEARAMAGHELDRLGDQSIPAEERDRRKRRLTKGPSEFREIRGDLPKPKR